MIFGYSPIYRHATADPGNGTGSTGRSTTNCCCDSAKVYLAVFWSLSTDMQCRFIRHGLAIDYTHTVKPCCTWTKDPEWNKQNHLSRVDLLTWHQSPAVIEKQQMLERDQWPESCVNCQSLESSGRYDSMRGNGNQAYNHYQDSDITLEIRPGSVCNFACQTCWPEASSRVAQYHHQAGFIDIKDVDSRHMENFDWLLPVAPRIRDVVLLGGEPFYDKNCKKFLAWCQSHLTANILIFTNGSHVDFDFIDRYPGRLTLVFSMDAMDLPAEYIRFGTVWTDILGNFQRCRKIENLEIRVNVTTSVYNLIYLEQLLSWLSQDWPNLVTFGLSEQRYPMFSASVIPHHERQKLVTSLEHTVKTLAQANIHQDQKSNAINYLGSQIYNVRNCGFNVDLNKKFTDFVMEMDRVKGINMQDYCPEVARYLSCQER